MINRDDDVAHAFATIAESFSGDFGVIDMLHTIVDECARALDISDVGVVLADADGELHILAATSERTALVEVLQVDSSTGPCWRSYRNGSPVSVPDIRTDLIENAAFRNTALGQHFCSVYATPLRGYNQTMGALNLFTLEPRRLNPTDAAVADSFARVAAMALLMDRRKTRTGIDRLQQALDSRVEIERAKALVAAGAGVSLEEAFRRIREHSLETTTPLNDVADALSARALSL